VRRPQGLKPKCILRRLRTTEVVPFQSKRHNPDSNCAIAVLRGCDGGVRADCDGAGARTALKNYGRQAWGMENGLPQNTVQALAQTKDGFVWLGTEVGLVRFDGNGFQVFDKNTKPGEGGPSLPGNDVRCLLAASDGALWIGTSEGLARWKDGSVAAFTSKEGLPSNIIRSVRVGPQGASSSPLRVERLAFKNPRLFQLCTTCWKAGCVL